MPEINAVIEYIGRVIPLIATGIGCTALLWF